MVWAHFNRRTCVWNRSRDLFKCCLKLANNTFFLARAAVNTNNTSGDFFSHPIPIQRRSLSLFLQFLRLPRACLPLSCILYEDRSECTSGPADGHNLLSNQLHRGGKCVIIPFAKATGWGGCALAASRAARRLHEEPSTLQSQNPAAAVAAVQSKQTHFLHFLQVEARRAADGLALMLLFLFSKEDNDSTSLIWSRKLFQSSRNSFACNFFF